MSPQPYLAASACWAEAHILMSPAGWRGVHVPVPLQVCALPEAAETASLPAPLPAHTVFEAHAAAAGGL